MIRKFALLFILSALAAPAATPVHAQPSYSCDGSLTATERTICGASTLGRLDLAMSSLYTVAVDDGRTGTDPDAAIAGLRDTQRAWLSERNGCGTDTDCLRARYLQRIDVLRSRIGAASAAAGPRRVGDVQVLADGSIERRRADGSRIVRDPRGRVVRFDSQGNRSNGASAAMVQAQPVVLPALPTELSNWGEQVNGGLSRVIRNMLTPEEYAAYRTTEAEKDFYKLVDWRLRSITFLTEER